MTELFVKAYTRMISAQERGAGMAEYVLLLALVAALMTAAFSGLVTAMIGQLTNIATEVGTRLAARPHRARVAGLAGLTHGDFSYVGSAFGV